MRLTGPVVRGFIDEVEKIAKKLSEEDKSRISVGEKILGTGTGLLGVGVPAGIASAGAGMATGPMNPAEQASSMGDVAKLRKAMDMPDPVTLARDPVIDQMGGGANAMPMTEARRAELKLKPGQHSRSYANPSVGVGTLAHEMGHGKFVRNPLGRAVRTIAGPAKLLGGLGGVGMAALGDPEGDAVKYAPLVGAAGALPQIGEEAAADIMGLRGLHRAGYRGSQLARAAGRRALGFGSYLAGVGAPMVLTPYAIGKARKYWKKRLEEDAGEAEVE